MHFADPLPGISCLCSTREVDAKDKSNRERRSFDRGLCDSQKSSHCRALGPHLWHLQHSWHYLHFIGRAGMCGGQFTWQRRSTPLISCPGPSGAPFLRPHSSVAVLTVDHRIEQQAAQGLRSPNLPYHLGDGQLVQLYVQSLQHASSTQYTAAA